MGQKRDTHTTTAMLMHEYSEYRYGDPEDRKRRQEERDRYDARHACRRTKMAILLRGDR